MLRMHFVWEQQGKSQSGSAASRAFFANRNIFCNKAASFRKRCFFFKIVTPGACFAAGHKKVYKTDLDTKDYECSFSPVASLWRWPTQPHKLAEPAPQRNSRPSQSYGPRGTWEITTAKHQRSKHHCRKVFS